MSKPLKKMLLTPFSGVRQAGMSLIEIMIVFGLIAGLMAFLISNFSQKADQAKADQARIGVGTLQSALQLYRVHNGKYPTTDQGLKALLTAPGDLKSWRGPYTEENKLKDPWNNEYTYESDGKALKIVSGGIDGTVGTDDDIVYPETTSAKE